MQENAEKARIFPMPRCAQSPGCTPVGERHAAPGATLPSGKAIVKMANAPSLSLRGPKGAVAISERQLQLVPATVKMASTKVWGVAAVSDRHWQPQVMQQ